MLLEILKSVLPFIGGGLAGAFLNEWFRRRSGRVHPIPLIERVKRLVNPELKGFALARVAGGPDNPRLEVIGNLREYQMTLRNTSVIHLQDAEIQFDFPTEDVEAWASRPSLSKTALSPVNASIADPWKKSFRWRIPYLPSTDSVEFSFRAVDPPSDDYEVALYKADRVVVQRSKGEPTSGTKADSDAARALVSVLGVVIASVALAGAVQALFNRTGTQSSTFNEGGVF